MTDTQPTDLNASAIALNAEIDRAPLLFDRLLNGISRLCLVAAGVALVTLTVIFGWLVYGRYVLNSTPTWVEQVALLLVMVITFIGAAIGVHERTHLGVQLLRNHVPRTMRRIMQLVCHLAMLIFGVVMAWHGTKLAIFKWQSLIPLIDVPEGVRAIPIALCGLLVTLFSIGHLIRMARGYDEDAGKPDVVAE